MTSIIAAGDPPSVLQTIERELRALWSENGPLGEGVVRVCTVNLVVVAGSRTIAQRYLPIVDEVIHSIPARAIVVVLAPEEPSHTLAGEVTAVLAPNASESSERIVLTATGDVCERVSSAVYGLLVPELPTVMVWLGRVHVDDPIFASLAREAQRVVLDTDYTSLGSLVQLGRWARAAEGRPYVADLAWTRIAPWLELCARFFDDPELTPLARHVTEIVVSQASSVGAPVGSEAALFLGWLATRLHWQARHIGDHLQFTGPDGRPIPVSVSSVERPAEVSPLALARVRITAKGLGMSLKASIERDLASGIEGTTPDADVLVWRLEVDGRPPVIQRVRLDANRGARLLERTLHRPPLDEALTESVTFAEELFEDGLVCS